MDFPDPVPPRIPKVDPALILKLTPCKTSSVPLSYTKETFSKVMSSFKEGSVAFSLSFSGSEFMI